MIRSQLGVSCVQSCKTCPPEAKQESVSEEVMGEATITLRSLIATLVLAPSRMSGVLTTTS